MEDKEIEIVDKAFAYLSITDLSSRVKIGLSGIRAGTYYKYVSMSKKRLREQAEVRTRAFENLKQLAHGYDAVKRIYGSTIITSRLNEASDIDFENILEQEKD